MIRLLMTLCLLTLADLAAAQTAVVRSGAHEGFDRLVLDMPTRIEWRTELREGGASLIFENEALRFDVGAAFERIGRERLRAISVPGSGGRLELDFACACRLRVFWHGTSMLVLDILDDEPSETPFEEIAAPRSRAGISETSISVPRRSPASGAVAERIRTEVGPRKAAAPGNPPADAARPDLRTMNQTLLQELGRAASQGLITLSAPARPRVSNPAPETPLTVKDAEMPTKAEPINGAAQVPLAAQPALRARTSMDRDVGRETPRDGDADASNACPSASFMDVRTWGGTRSFWSEIGRLNGSLYGEFDRLDGASALRLARLYIHHGFGAEAHHVLDLLDPAAPGVAIARELANVVDHNPQPEGALAGALHCGEPAVLWSLLATLELHEDRVFDHSALKRSFVTLSGALRRSLGPVLVRRLVSAGHDRTAAAVFRLIGGSEDRSGAESEFAKAALAKSLNEPAEVDTALRQVVRSNTAQSAEALADRMETWLRRDQPVTVADSQLASALAFEHRGTPVGNRLAGIYLEALAASGAFENAIREFDRLHPSLANEKVSQVAARIVAALVNAADDVTFLRHIMTDRLAQPETFPEPLVLAVADRLLALGFIEHGSRYVEAVDFEDSDRDARLLRARLALAEENAVEAELEIAGLDGREADMLRARALALRGEHDAARRLFAAHDAATQVDRAALRLGQADAMASAQAPLLKEVAQTLDNSANDTSIKDASGIQETRGLLDESATMREVFRRFVASMPAPSSTN